MFSRRGRLAMKNPDPNEPEGEDPQAQQVDLEDADVSAEPSQLPPGLPPLPPQEMAPVPPSSMAPPMGSAQSAASSRSPMFYVGVLVGVLLVSAAIGTVVALSRRRAPAATATAPTSAGTSSASSASGAPKVITIRTIEMDDNPDSGP
jgi:hypothetical protein